MFLDGEQTLRIITLLIILLGAEKAKSSPNYFDVGLELASIRGTNGMRHEPLEVKVEAGRIELSFCRHILLGIYCFERYNFT